MSLEILRTFFMWCSIINYSVLILWFVLFAFAYDGLKGFSEVLFRRRIEHFDAIHVLAMAFFKGGVILFNVVPWIALSIAR